MSIHRGPCTFGIAGRYDRRPRPSVDGRTRQRSLTAVPDQNKLVPPSHDWPPRVTRSGVTARVSAVDTRSLTHYGCWVTPVRLLGARSGRVRASSPSSLTSGSPGHHHLLGARSRELQHPDRCRSDISCRQQVAYLPGPWVLRCGERLRCGCRCRGNVRGRRRIRGTRLAGRDDCVSIRGGRTQPAPWSLVRHRVGSLGSGSYQMRPRWRDASATRWTPTT